MRIGDKVKVTYCGKITTGSIWWFDQLWGNTWIWIKDPRLEKRVLVSFPSEDVEVIEEQDENRR